MKIKFLAFAIVLFFISCADESLGPVATFDTSGKGAYVRLLSENERFVNLFDVPGANYVYSVELVDFEQGALISEYNLDLTFDDNDPSNGDNSQGPIRLKSFSASDFEDLASGFKGLSNISVKATEMLAALGLTEDDISAGDVFIVDGSLTLDDGRVFAAANSTAAVNGSAFQGHFSYRLSAGCPSSLDGTYDYRMNGAWCDGDAVVESTVDIIQTSAGTYVFSDWSLGSYSVCYSPTSVAAQTSITFGDVCAVLSFTGFVDSYGDTWTFDSSIEGNEWKINYVNTYGEGGNAIVFYPGGADWPVTLK